MPKIKFPNDVTTDQQKLEYRKQHNIYKPEELAKLINSISKSDIETLNKLKEVNFLEEDILETKYGDRKYNLFIVMCLKKKPMVINYLLTVENNQDDFKKRLLASRDISQNTILHIVAEYPQHPQLNGIAKQLIEFGADFEVTNNVGQTPLLVAATKSNTETAKLLLTAGANPKAEDQNKNTALHFAAEKNHIELIKMLLKQNGTVNSSNNNGETPLHLAAANYFSTSNSVARNAITEVLYLLVKAGANLNSEDNKGITPVSKLLVSPELVHLLHSLSEQPIKKALELLVETVVERLSKIERKLDELQSAAKSATKIKWRISSHLAEGVKEESSEQKQPSQDKSSEEVEPITTRPQVESQLIEPVNKEKKSQEEEIIPSTASSTPSILKLQ